MFKILICSGPTSSPYDPPTQTEGIARKDGSSATINQPSAVFSIAVAIITTILVKILSTSRSSLYPTH